MNTQLKASTSTRILATVIDVIIMYILFIGISSLIVNPLIKSTTNYEEQYQFYEATLISSRLAIKDESNQLQVACYDFKVSDIDSYETILSNFYSSFSADDEFEKFIESKKSNENLFIYNEENNTFTLKDDVEDSLETFYNEAFSSALNYLYNNNSDYQSAYSTITFYMYLDQYVSLGLSATIVFLLMPIIFKNGKTIGKKLFKLSLSTTEDSLTPVKFSKVFIRYLAILIIEIIGSYVLGFLPVLISVITLTLTKKNFALHDYIAKTYVINDKGVNSNILEAEIVSNKVNEEVIEVKEEQKENNVD